MDKIRPDTLNVTGGVICKMVPLCIANGEWNTPGYEVLECYADRFVINDELATIADAAEFVRRMTDAGVVELLRGSVSAIETSSRWMADG